jgi:hypothetical protein
MEQQTIRQEQVTTTKLQSSIHYQLAQTIREHRQILRRYFEKMEEKQDVHLHLQQAVDLVRKTARQYRYENIETILERLNPTSINHETAFILHHSVGHPAAQL